MKGARLELVLATHNLLDDADIPQGGEPMDVAHSPFDPTARVA